MVTGPRVPIETIIKLNDLGLSLKRIGQIVGYHYTTVRLRLEEAGVQPVDTRRAFMDEIYDTLTPHQREWLIQELHLGQPISAFIRLLIVDKFNQRSRNKSDKD